MSSISGKRSSLGRASIGSPGQHKRSLGTGSSSASGGATASETLTVLCRFRAPKANAPNTASPYLYPDPKVVKVNLDAYDSKLYQFDAVFPPTTQQPELFDAVEGTIDAVMGGFNATILAYGQTSAGKTHTMEGPNIRANLSMLGADEERSEADSQLGIIPRTIEKLF